jgi:hypothetical protein
MLRSLTVSNLGFTDPGRHGDIPICWGQQGTEKSRKPWTFEKGDLGLGMLFPFMELRKDRVEYSMGELKPKLHNHNRDKTKYILRLRISDSQI